MLTIQNFSHDPYYNQALEEYVFQTYRNEDLFFLWQNRPAVIVGKHQNICREVSVPALHRLGIPVIRRMSGGGTVYHDSGNINYTYIFRHDGPLDYDRCLSPVLAALQDMGIPAHKNRTCDIAIGGQKISGSAQLVAGGRFLHHGTLLFQTNLTVLDQITTQHKNDCFQSKGTVSAICPVTNLSEHLPAPMTLPAFRQQLLERIVPDRRDWLTLTAAQEAAVCQLRDEKYRSWDWTWGKNPAFQYEKSGILLGSPIRVAYRAKKGVISDALVDCAILDGSHAAALLNGSRLDPDRFLHICQALLPDQPEALLSWLL